MTDKPWRLQRLSGMATEWLASREALRSSMNDHLENHLRHVTCAQPKQINSIDYATMLAAIDEHITSFVHTLDHTIWYTLPQRLAANQHELTATFGAVVTSDAQRLASVIPPQNLAGVHHTVQRALAVMQHILQVIAEMQQPFNFAAYLFAQRLASQLKHLLYPVRTHLSAMQRYWLSPDVEVAACDPMPSQVHPESGIQRHAIDGHRGAYTCYIPEYYRPEQSWPLILALHGGHGHDEDFLWRWLKYAKSCGYLLICAKSFGSTWHPWDIDSLLLILDHMQPRFNVDTQRVLLTGLSDGGTFSYEVGFAHPERFGGLAVVAGTMRPRWRSPHAHRLPIYIAHGDQDPLFPIGHVRATVRTLQEWGHHVTYHEIADLKHTYPPEENGAILDWFATATENTTG